MTGNTNNPAPLDTSSILGLCLHLLLHAGYQQICTDGLAQVSFTWKPLYLGPHNHRPIT